jgi:glycosyltransferase involved in cell wall biosynthesis
VIPVYNHETAIGTVVDALLARPAVHSGGRRQHPVLRARAGCAGRARHVHLVRLTLNQGKGGAVMTGLREAARLGFSHALQVDADGQHDLHDVARLSRNPAPTRTP